MLILSVLVIAGCSSPTDTTDHYVAVTSLSPLTSITEAIAGSKIEVIGLIPEGENSHEFEPAPSLVTTLEKADVIILNGFNLETHVIELAKTSKKETTDIVLLAEGKPIIVECPEGQNFKITANQLEKNITEKTKWLMLNSPSNPTGAVYSKSELKELAKVLLKYPHVLIMSDDIYEKIIYDILEFGTLASIEPRLKDRCLTLNGVSKAYCMTGWRLGYCGASKEIIAAMNKMQSQSNTSTSSISMAAAVEALEGSQEFIKEHNEAFVRRRDMVVSLLNQIEGINCLTPEGAFYVYPSCEGVIGKQTPNGNKIANDEDFMNYLLESEGIAGVHGAAFGLSPYFRLSYATSDEILKDACSRIKRACEKLK